MLVTSATIIVSGDVVDGYCYGTGKYPHGTTETGRNMLKHRVYGMQIGLKLGLSAAMIMAVITTAVGTTAGYYGGRIEDILIRIVDTVPVVPAIVVYMVVATMYLGTLQGFPTGCSHSPSCRDCSTEVGWPA